MRTLVPGALGLALLSAAAAPAPAQAQLRLSDNRLAGLTSAGGQAYAVVETGRDETPYALLRSNARRSSERGVFGSPRTEWVDVAADPGGRVSVGWGRPISPGFEQRVATADALADSDVLGLGTGPAQLLLPRGGARVLAYADRRGDAAVARAAAGEEAGTVEVLTDDAPEVRHAVRDILAGSGDRVLVLDRAQTRTRTDLLLHGARPARIVRVARRRSLDATVTRDAAGRPAVAYTHSGYVRLARLIGGRWRVQKLPGKGGQLGAPAIVRTGSRLRVVYAQMVRDQRELFVATSTGTRRASVRRFTRAIEHDVEPFAAPGPGGTAYVGWTRLARRTRAPHAVLAILR